MLFSIIALEKFAQKSENKATIKRKLAMFPENPLLRLERHANSSDYTLRQVGYCARWCLDNYCKYIPLSVHGTCLYEQSIKGTLGLIDVFLWSYYRRSQIFIWSRRCIKCERYAEYQRRIRISENITRRLGSSLRCLSVWERSMYISSEFRLLVLRSDHYHAGCHANRLGYKGFQLFESRKFATRFASLVSCLISFGINWISNSKSSIIGGNSFYWTHLAIISGGLWYWWWSLFNSIWRLPQTDLAQCKIFTTRSSILARRFRSWLPAGFRCSRSHFQPWRRWRGRS